MKKKGVNALKNVVDVPISNLRPFIKSRKEDLEHMPPRRTSKASGVVGKSRSSKQADF